MTKFRKFTDQMEYSGEPSAKLYKHGQIGFNRVAGQLWFSDVDYVEILVDEDENELAFRPAAETTEGTYKFSRDGEYGGHVSVRSVLSYYGIWHERMDESIALPVRYDEDEDLVVVDLSEPLDRWGRPSMKNVDAKRGGGPEDG